MSEENTQQSASNVLTSIPTTSTTINEPAQTSASIDVSSNVSSFDWSKQGLDENSLNFVKNKGWKSPVDQLTSYRNLEKLIGVPQERLLKLPSNKDDPTEWNNVYDRLGRPKNATEYEVNIPQGTDPKFAEAAKNKFHELGLSAKQGRELASWWSSYAENVSNTEKETYSQSLKNDVTLLKGDWGGAYNENIDLIKNVAIPQLNITPPMIDALEAVIGYKDTMKFLHNIASRLPQEGQYIAGATPQFNSPETAKARINELRRDKSWIARFASGDTDARNEIERLHKIAYPGNTTIG